MMKIATFRSAALAAVLLGGATRAQAATITEYPLAQYATPLGIALGPDGNMWFAESVGNKIGRITPSGQITEFPLATAQSYPNYVLAGPRGRMYFGEPGTAQLGYIDVLGNQQVVEKPFNGGIGAAVGPGHDLWLVHADNTVTYWYVPGDSGSTGCTLMDGQPHQFDAITYDADGHLFILDSAQNAFVYLSDVSSTCQFIVSNPLPYPSSGARSITFGRDGQFWFTEYTGDRIGRIGDDSLHEYPLAPGSQPNMIVASPDGTLWFTEHGANKIGHITHGGTITEYTVPTPNSKPWGIAVGPDGSVWFTEEQTSKIGRLQLHPFGDANGDGLVNVSDVFYLINFLFGGGPAPK
jgi:streptogramin lyase